MEEGQRRLVIVKSKARIGPCAIRARLPGENTQNHLLER